jgi:hypothetical protein
LTSAHGSTRNHYAVAPMGYFPPTALDILHGAPSSPLATKEERTNVIS